MVAFYNSYVVQLNFFGNVANKYPRPVKARQLGKFSLLKNLSFIFFYSECCLFFFTL